MEAFWQRWLGNLPLNAVLPGRACTYDFRYDINDQYGGNFYGHSEVRDGAVTQGSYYVQLPDSRLMKVNYIADEYGYHPTITYEGEAQHPGQEFLPPPKDAGILTPATAPIHSSISIRAPIGTPLPNIVPGPFTHLSRPFLGVSPVHGELLSLPADPSPLQALHGPPVPFLHSSPAFAFQEPAPLPVQVFGKSGK
ncbi:cuticle protein 18.6-like [Macrobrachium nipponense]|uniref:cuticle protein 18.6-like n=1 Tax=Macrobrachium nipponense TaxID=159736 RepID=UPI0030C7EAA6